MSFSVVFSLGSLQYFLYTTGRALYGLAGYKVWLGSVSTDGTRLVSDGQDNRVIVHDFSPGLDGDL